MSKSEGYYELGRSVAREEKKKTNPMMCLKAFLLKSVVLLALASRVAGFSAWETITGILERES